MNNIEAWHFISEDRRMIYGDKDLIEPDKTYKIGGEPILCRKGLHASIRAIDALQYAPGPIVCRVVLSGAIIGGTDKHVATERTVLWMEDASKELQSFARWCALEVAHLWEMPKIVRDYLETGDESLKDLAKDSVKGSAWDSAWDSAKYWAEVSVIDSIGRSAKASAVAWDSAYAAAEALAKDSVKDLAIAWDLAESSVEALAYNSAMEKHNTELEKRLMAMRGISQ